MSSSRSWTPRNGCAKCGSEREFFLAGASSALAILVPRCYTVALMGTLYYGDNLDILTRYIVDETVDLVYLDPPFNSAQNDNAFFQEKDGTAAAAQPPCECAYAR